MQQTYRVIGLMSGTSLDGLDIAYCIFSEQGKTWKFSIEKAATVNYDGNWRKVLQQAHKLSAADILKLHNTYGEYLGKATAKFIKDNAIKKVDFVASHGHTIFHQPEKKFTFQLGSGAALTAACKLPVVNDFRSLDVALNGQGAPLVPIGDKLLFGEYKHCINLGGFANISFDNKGKRIAFDICPVNIVLNHLASLNGKEFDKGGRMAASGSIDKDLYKKLNNLPYYKQNPPKSLGREWVEEVFMHVLNKSKLPTEDKMATVVMHIAEQIAGIIRSQKNGKVLLTGGGAFNTFLVEQIQGLLPSCEIVIPSDEIVKYKEALIFAFLGVLRWEGKDNCLASVTGASTNNKGGTIYLV